MSNVLERDSERVTMGESDFDQFWNLYPKKVGRFESVGLWLALKKEDRAAALEALPSHVALWAREGRMKSKILNPANFLRGRRWEDEIDGHEEIPATVVAWWASEQGIMDKGRELGVRARGGESMAEYKARVVEAARKAA